MNKVHKSLLIILLILSLAPLAFSAEKSPLYLKKLQVYTRVKDQGIAADMMICNRTSESLKFVLQVENLTIGTRYKRNFSSRGTGCRKQYIVFKKTFATTANDGDEIVFTLKKVRDNSGEKYINSRDYLRVVEDRYPTQIPCGDEMGKDGDYELCVGDFVTHEPTNVRIKLTSHDRKKVDLLVTGFRWGEVKKVRLYEGRAKKLIVANRDRIEITYAGRSENGNVILIIETQ